MNNRDVQTIQNVANTLINNAGIIPTVVVAADYVTSWWWGKSPIDEIKKAKRIIYQKIDTKNQADMLAKELDVTPDGKLYVPYNETDIDIEGKIWDGGERVIYLKNAAKIFASYLKHRRGGSCDDHRAYIAFHAIKSLHKLSTKELNDNLIHVLEHLHHGWDKLSGDNDLVAPSSSPTMIHLKPMLIRANKYLKKVIKVAEYDLYHQASSQHLNQIYRANESIHLDNIPSFILHLISGNKIHAKLNFRDFSKDSWGEQNNTLLQAILYLYLTKIATMTSQQELDFSASKNLSAIKLINAIDSTIKRKKIQPDTEGYFLGVIEELRRIKIEQGNFGNYGYYYYFDDGHDRQCIKINTGFASEFQTQKTLEFLCNVLKKTIVTGCSYSAQKTCYNISKNFGDYGLYVESRIQLKKVLLVSVESLNDLSCVLRELLDWSTEMHNNRYANRSAPKFQQENMNSARQFLNTQIHLHIDEIIAGKKIIVSHIEKWELKPIKVNKVEEFRVATNYINHFIGFARKIRQQPGATTPPIVNEASPPLEEKTIIIEQKNIDDSVTTWSVQMANLLTKFSDESLLIAAFITLQKTLDSEDILLSKKQRKLEKILGDSQYNDIANSELKPIYNGRVHVLHARLGLFSHIDASYHHLKDDPQIQKCFSNFSNDVNRGLNTLPLLMTNNDQSNYEHELTVAQSSLTRILR